MSNSNLVNYKKISPNKTNMNNKIIKKITIHHMAGNLSVEQCGNVFADSSRRASSNYGIGSDGRVGLYVEEKDRAWTSSNAQNDCQAVTIEVANNTLDPNWTVSDVAYNKLIDLCVDICKRNNIKKLNWTGDANGNLTCHYMFAKTLCPGPYLKGCMSEIAETVNKRLNVQSNNKKIKKDMSIKEIYNYFISKSLTPCGVCGLLGNLQAESGIRANNLQNSFESKFNLSDEAYTEKMQSFIDKNKLEEFYSDKAGYGLAQWTFWNRKKALAEYSVKVGHTIDSMQMQVEFLYNELCTSYKSVLNVLTTSNSISECSNCVLTQFEKPKIQDDIVKNTRIKNSLAFYDKLVSNKKDEELKVPFTVKVEIKTLNIRRGPSTNYAITGKCPVGKYTIIEVKKDISSDKGWGKLKSGAGWISLDHVKIL